MLSNSPDLVSNLAVRCSETRISTTGSPKAPRWCWFQAAALQKKKKKNHKSQITKSQRKKKNHFIDLPTTTVSESPRWGLEWTKLLRLGWGGSFGWWVGGEGRPATGPKKVSLCNKTSLDNKQNEKQKDQWQASSWRLLVRLAVGRLSPL